MSVVLETMSRMSKIKDDNAIDAQGTGYLLRNKNIATKELLKDDKADRNDCRKDTGEKCTHKLSRSRGVFCAISGGGIIRKWDTLFGSEGQTQVGLLMTSFVHTYLGLMIPNPDDWRNFFLVYDNMCHIAELKLLQQPLALPEPFDKMWDKETGVRTKIDPLHILNHKRPQCKVLYDPADVKVNIIIIIIVVVIIVAVVIMEIIMVVVIIVAVFIIYIIIVVVIIVAVVIIDIVIVFVIILAVIIILIIIVAVIIVAVVIMDIIIVVVIIVAVFIIYIIIVVVIIVAFVIIDIVIVFVIIVAVVIILIIIVAVIIVAVFIIDIIIFVVIIVVVVIIDIIIVVVIVIK